MTTGEIALNGAIIVLGVIGIIWIAWDTDRNLRRKALDLAPESDSLWILSSEIYLDHGIGGSWVRVRQGVYADPNRVFEEFEKLQSAIDKDPHYNRAALCERVKVIR